MSFQKKMVLMDSSHQEIGIIALEQLYADIYAIKIKKIEPTLSIDLWSDAFSELVKEAHLQKAARIEFRLIKNAGLDNLKEILLKVGFYKKIERVEFKKLVEQLPTDLDQSQLNWKTAEELNWNENQIAGAVKLVAEDDPNFDPSEDPLSFIQDFLNHDEYTAGRNFIHLGFIQDRLAAMTVVQLDFNPGINYGWSRISYMGVVKALRNRGMGKLVHQYSFRIMKSFGGKLYHGGTTKENIPMIKLFEFHKCESFKEMEEWTNDLNEAQYEKN